MLSTSLIGRLLRSAGTTRFFFIAALATSALAGLAAPASAQFISNFTGADGGNPNDWNDSANWDTGVPGSPDGTQALGLINGFTVNINSTPALAPTGDYLGSGIAPYTNSHLAVGLTNSALNVNANFTVNGDLSAGGGSIITVAPGITVDNSASTIGQGPWSYIGTSGNDGALSLLSGSNYITDSLQGSGTLSSNGGIVTASGNSGGSNPFLGVATVNVQSGGLTLNSAGYQTNVTTAITGSAGGSLTFTDSVGGGTINVNAQSALNGQVNINGGTVVLNGGYGQNGIFQLGGAAGVVVNSGGTLVGNSTDVLGYYGSGMTGITVNAGGTYDLNARQSFDVPLYLNGGTVNLQAGGGSTTTRLSDIVVNAPGGQTSTIANPNGDGSYLDATSTVFNVTRNATGSTPDLIVSAPIGNGMYTSNPPTVTVAGNGITQFTNGNNSYTGGTTITGGTLIAGGTALSTGGVNVGSGSTLQTGGVSGLLSQYFQTFNGGGPGSGLGYLDANGNGNPPPASFNASTPALFEQHVLGSYVTGTPQNNEAPLVQNTQTVDVINQGPGGNYPQPIPQGAYYQYFEGHQSGEINVPVGGNYTFGLNSDDGTVVWVDGKLVVSNNAYQGAEGYGNYQQTGMVSLTAGEHSIVVGYYQGTGGFNQDVAVQGPNDSQLYDLGSNSSSVKVTADTFVSNLSGAGNVVLNNSSLYFGSDGTSQNFTGGILAANTDAGLSGIVKLGAGTQVISGTLGYAGPTAVYGGTLQLGNGGAGGALGNGGTYASNLSLGGGSTLVLNSSSNQTLTGNVTGSGTDTFSLAGSGSTSISGTISGLTNFNASGSGSNTISGPITAVSNITQSGVGGTTTITSSNPTLAPAISVSGGTLATGALGVGYGSLNVASGGTFSVSNNSAGSGLTTQYFNESPNSANFVSLGALQSHVISDGTPALLTTTPVVSLFDTANNNNQFAGGTGFPAPYTANGVNFISYSSGTITIAAGGTYNFQTSSDDGSMLWIDGKQIVSNNFSQPVVTRGGSDYLTAGQHNIVIGYYQGGGGDAVQATINGPDTGNNTIALGAAGSPTLTPDLLTTNISGSGMINLTSAGLSTGTDNTSTEFSGQLTGTFGLTKLGTGTLTLAGDNSANTGLTFISQGTLQVGDGTLTGQLPSGNVIIGGDGNTNAALVFNSPGTSTVNGIVSGPGSLTQSGTGTTILANNNTYTGATTINAGTLQVGNGGTAGSLGTAGVTDNGNLVFNLSSNYVTPTITGSGNLAQSGSGTLQLGSSLTGLGSISTTAGTLDTNGQNASAGTFYLTGGSIINSSSGSSTLTASLFSISANTSISNTNGGTLTLTGNADSQAGGNALVSGNGTVVLNGTTDNVGLGVDLSSGTLLLDKQSSGGVHAIGGNGLTVTGGTVQFGTDAGAGSNQLYQGAGVSLSGTGTFDLTGTTQTFGALNAAGGSSQIITSTGNGVIQAPVNLTGSQQTVGATGAGSSLTFSNTIAGGGGINVIGPGTTVLATSNSYSGNTTVSGGLLNVTGSLANNGSNSIFVQSGGSTFGGLANPSGGEIDRAVASGATYAGYGSQDTGAGTNGTLADINAGTANNGAGSVDMSWRNIAANETVGSSTNPPFNGGGNQADFGLISDVLNLHGLATVGGPGTATDPFELSMTYNPSLIPGNLQSIAVDSDLLRLDYLNPATGLWAHATTADFATGALAVAGYQGTFSQFETQYGVNASDLSQFLGSWGTGGGTAWAILDHNSSFAVAVPEPSSIVLMLFGSLGLYLMGRRRKA